MQTKMIEIRDRMTCIPALAILMQPANPIESVYMRRCGYPVSGRSPMVILYKLSDDRGTSDPYNWGGCRTMTNAHLYIERNFHDLVDGQVVDVQVILGEATMPATPEIWP